MLRSSCWACTFASKSLIPFFPCFGYFFSRYLAQISFLNSDLCLSPFFNASLAVPSSSPEILEIALLKCLIESSLNESMDSGGRLQNHLKAAPFRLYVKSLHIMSSSMPVGMFVDLFVIRFVSGVSRTPRARLSNPGVEVVALCICEEKRCSICASNVLISLDIMLRIISSTFIVPGETGPSDGGGKSGVECRVELACFLESDPCVGCCCCCCCCAHLSFPIGVFAGVDRAALEPRGCERCFSLPEDSRA
ncbi:hypothetical protein TIFTF001_033311 [Ficus carica]|uniref:Uncharacterized protein n=1 Tax=Ficus carica TaxID=3494 RepID=A0AA88J910_FICCA|nr:hypothetical protein TIFTF001_033311 [Ficus carica]